jgi:carbohydrate kinase (thermoresistant glucokinase family)
MTAVVVMGVSGSGKSTVAGALAQRLGWLLMEGDSFHPAANVAKMVAGTPLTGEDRWPWLRAIAAAIDARRQAGESVVVACSALRRAYRDMLIDGHQDVLVVYLRGSKDLIAGRMAGRTGHFMPPALLDSQFATLEEPSPDEHAIVESVELPAATIIEQVLARIGERTA